MKDKDRREGKGRRCCLGGGRIDSFLCRVGYFAPGFEELFLHIILVQKWRGNDSFMVFLLFRFVQPAEILFKEVTAHAR